MTLRLVPGPQPHKVAPLGRRRLLLGWLALAAVVAVWWVGAVTIAVWAINTIAS